MDKLQRTDQKQPEKFLVSDRIPRVGDTWLSPRGKSYKCASNEHNAAADFLVGTSEFNQIRDGKKIEFNDEDSNRTKIEEIGYVLIRGNVLHIPNVLSLTSEQKEAMKKHRTLVITPFDAGKHGAEFKFVVGGLVDTIKQCEQYNRISDYQKVTVETIDKFGEDPFHTEIVTTSADWNEDELAEGNGVESLPVKIFNILSEGHYDEMKSYDGIDEFTFRIVDLGSEKLMVLRRKHHHGESGGGPNGAVQNYISIIVVDEKKLDKVMQNKILRDSQITKGADYKVVLSGWDGYFSSIVNRLSDKKLKNFPKIVIKT